ncbi:aa3-type cytochrome c oxidase subunit IV [Maricaulis sp.]|uniref:aa3-type cytochrome c oxidase subunit IV n=1 Tax=Maricaulis sp. TaxID=1486257 RepID=UPI002628D4D9|nr:aa3-type cytochrome c oxidase subunit IV [Maricaulis sp.]
MASDYSRGEMDISDHKATFDGFMAVTVWGSLLTAISVLYLTLVFAVGMDWLASLIGVAVVSVLGGMALNMKVSWYVTVAGLFIFSLICGGIVSLFGMFLAG